MEDGAGERYTSAPWRRYAIWLGVSLAALAALAHIGLLSRIIVGRIGYPLDLEWMESGMLVHALRVAQGLPLYAEPSVDFISYLYTPFYPYLVGTLGRIFGVSYLLGRIVSLLCFMAALGVAFRVAQRESVAVATALTPRARRLWGVAWGLTAVGLVAASFPHTGAWYDLVRNDSLYLALVSTALYLLRYHVERWRWVFVAGVLLGLAFLTKQTASLFILFAGAATLLTRWRRLLLLVPVVALVAGGTVLVGSLLTEGWMWRYIFELHQGHDLYWERVWPQTELKLGKLMPASYGVAGLWLLVALGTWLKGRRLPDAHERRLLFWWFLVIVGLAVSAIGFATQWAVQNAYIPGFYFAAIFAAVGAADLAARLGLGRRPLWAASVALICGGALCGQLLGQLYKPGPHLPQRGSYAAADKLLARMHAVEGPILMPYHPFYPHLVGRPAHYHQMGVNDITRAGLRFPRSIHQAIAQQRYGAVIFDTSPKDRHDYFFILRHYKFAHYLRADESPRVVTGYGVQPRYVLVPKRQEPPPPGARVVFDFESGRYKGWKVSGRAFGTSPAGGDRGNQGLAGPFGGRYLASSLVRGDSATGGLISPEFVIDRPQLSYRIGGGRDKERLVMRLVVVGQGEVHRDTGVQSHIMQRRELDMADFLGRRAHIELIDNAQGGWGHLLFDDLLLHGKPKPAGAPNLSTTLPAR
ncbi:MAG: glycosyltransferase family 39 protein [Deltaproteobacteria bacterium]|nr:glycosyltransferase family 39 protein [Deltaproteobacteria bacterium]